MECRVRSIYSEAEKLSLEEEEVSKGCPIVRQDLIDRSVTARESVSRSDSAMCCS